MSWAFEVEGWVKMHFNAAGRDAESRLLSPKFHRESSLLLPQCCLTGGCLETGKCCGRQGGGGEEEEEEEEEKEEETGVSSLWQ